jgi:uncharacterized protein
MPGKDGTGPEGQGPVQGRGLGRGRMHGFGRGSSEYCVCPNCGEVIPHTPGTPCNQMKCPKCSTLMTRK